MDSPRTPVVSSYYRRKHDAARARYGDGRSVQPNAAETLDFIADWANDCNDGDTFYGFADIEARARAAAESLRLQSTDPSLSPDQEDA